MYAFEFRTRGFGEDFGTVFETTLDADFGRGRLDDGVGDMGRSVYFLRPAPTCTTVPSGHVTTNLLPGTAFVGTTGFTVNFLLETTGFTVNFLLGTMFETTLDADFGIFGLHTKKIEKFPS